MPEFSPLVSHLFGALLYLDSPEETQKPPGRITLWALSVGKADQTLSAI